MYQIDNSENWNDVKVKLDGGSLVGVVILLAKSNLNFMMTLLQC